MEILAKFVWVVLVTAVLTDKVEDQKPKTRTYTTKYDDVNLDDILHTDRLLLNYVNCLLDKGHCTPDGTELKKNLPDAINNDCEKCSEKQKIGSNVVIHYLIDNKSDWWTQLERKYNPDGSYRKAYLVKKANQEKQNKD